MDVERLGGVRMIDINSPEAIAFAEASGIELPTQEEYENRISAFAVAGNEDADTARDLMVALSRLRTHAENPTPENYQSAYEAASAAMFRYSNLVFTGEPSNKTRDLFLLVQARSLEALTNGTA